MTLKFTTQAKNEVAVLINVKIDTSKASFTRGEARRKKRNIQNLVHAMLIEYGYDVCEIKTK